MLPIVMQLVWKAKCHDALIDVISWGSVMRPPKVSPTLAGAFLLLRARHGIDDVTLEQASRAWRS